MVGWQTWRCWLVLGAAACASCNAGGSDVSSDADDTQGGDTQGGDTQGGDTKGGDTQGGDTQGAETQGADTQSDSGVDPPGSCGWSGAGYTCGFEGSDPAGTPSACPEDATPWGACEAQGPTNCCDADGNALWCSCDGNACEYQWKVTDCTHSTGAGACGWWAEWSTYSCGGDGADPGGAPMSCPEGLEVGADCPPVDQPQLASCCDANGDQWTCTEGGNGGPSTWGTVDC